MEWVQMDEGEMEFDRGSTTVKKERERGRDDGSKVGESDRGIAITTNKRSLANPWRKASASSLSAHYAEARHQSRPGNGGALDPNLLTQQKPKSLRILLQVWLVWSRDEVVCCAGATADSRSLDCLDGIVYLFRTLIVTTI